MATPTAPPDKPRFLRADALDVAREMCLELRPACERLLVAGSLRRRKDTVGDVEILYIPKQGMARFGELFEQPKNLADFAIDELLRRFVVKKRRNINGCETFGEKNKLLVHVLSGIPVDLFAATPENWWNYLVCRTGGTGTNTLIANRAKERGYKWNPYGCGFTRLSDDEAIPMDSEEAVFRFVGLRYEEPELRR